MDEYTHIEGLESENKQIRFANRYIKIRNRMLGGLAAIALSAGVYGIVANQNDSEDQPILDNPIAACAFNMIDSQATLEDTELAVSRCDTQGNLIDLQVTIMAHQVLETVREQS
jgi:hypothetical protein